MSWKNISLEGVSDQIADSIIYVAVYESFFKLSIIHSMTLWKALQNSLKRSMSKRREWQINLYYIIEYNCLSPHFTKKTLAWSKSLLLSLSSITYPPSLKFLTRLHMSYRISNHILVLAYLSCLLPPTRAHEITAHSAPWKNPISLEGVLLILKDRSSLSIPTMRCEKNQT